MSTVGMTIAILATLPFFSCAGFRYPEGPSPGEYASLRTLSLPRIVVGVQEPEVRLDAKPSKRGNHLTAENTILEMVRSNHLIDALRSTNLFGRVDFVDQLGMSPDVIIKLDPGPSSTPTDTEVLRFILSVGIIPLMGTDQEGVYFSRVDRKTAPFVFDWPVMCVAGWVGPIFLAIPGSHIERNPEAFKAALTKYLVERRDDLWGKGRQL
jgi:hypothetical protein